MDFQVLATIKIMDYETPDFKPKIFTGIRPIIRYEGMIGGSCALDLGDKKEAFPGETVEVSIDFLNPENHKPLMYVGLSFGLYAGNKKLAVGIVNVLD
ncbi:hypothetical protein [Alteromonas mediterranea]|uniref:hypothetical protein n=1 Tax=Alteromonas mediterranea TaxID=314275 RepID=UPI002FE1456A|tara:strand:+ start:1959 stop:2252 length:294 start_codon:yes stop_codon:yes gene_type:complete